MEITIPKESSKFNNIELYEDIDVSRIDELLTFELKEETEYKQLQQYKKLIQAKKSVKYIHSQKNNIGRVFSKNGLSLQSFRKEIRWYLAHDKYDDIDMVNAYPTILLQLCKTNLKNSKEYKHLQSYVENRNAILNKLKCERRKAKMLYITLLHGGTIDRWRQECKCENVDVSKVKPSHFSNEMRKLIQYFHKHNKHLGIKKATTTISIVLQYYENKILEVVYDYLKKHNYINDNNSCVLCFDGLMIPKSRHNNNQKLLQDLQDVVHEQTGFEIVFDFKKMIKPKFEQRKSKCLITVDKDEDKYDNYISHLKEGEVGCSNLCVSHFKNIVKKITLGGSKFYCYNDKQKLWIKSTKSMVMKMFNIYLKKCYSFCYHYNSKNNKNDIDSIEYLLSKLNQNSFLSNVVSLSNDELFEKHFIFKLNSLPHLLPIKNNKIINLKTLEIRDRKYDDYFTDSIEYEYIPNLKENKFEKFISDLLRDNDYTHFFHKIMGYNITAETKEQLIPFWWGKKGGNAKSLLVKLISKVLGDTFTGVFPKELLIENKNINAHLHLFSLMYCRCVFLSESNENDNLDFSQVKKFSGEDKVKCRGHYEDPIDYYPYFKINNPLNFLYKFNTNDTAFIRRIFVMPFNYYFRKKTDYDFKKDDKYCRVLDKTKGEKLEKNLDHIFTWLVNGAYKYYQEGLDDVPDIMVEAKKEYIEDHDAVLTFINDMFEKYDPDNKEHFSCNDYNKKVMKDDFKIDSATMDRYFYYFMRENKGKYGNVIKKQFKVRMKNLGYDFKNIGNCWGYEGLRYKPVKEECEINNESDSD